MTPNVVDGLIVSLIVAIASILLVPVLLWVLPHRYYTIIRAKPVKP
jgi:hypothetical protein